MGVIKSRKLPCQKCGAATAIRTTIKEGDDKGLKVCPFCKPRKMAKKSYIRRITNKTKKKNKERSERRSSYFMYHILLCSVSEESGKHIKAPNRANIAHIIDKGRHKSLEDNLDNYVYLTLDEHTKFDNLLFSLRFEDLEIEFPNEVCRMG